jgi:hypothetical protein
MARWALSCKNCFKVLPEDETGVAPAERFLLKKPKLPPGGLVLECPDCKTACVYHETDLWLEADVEGEN